VGNYRISVSADMDLSQREQTFQTFGEEPRLRSEIVRDKNVVDELAIGIPGSLSNTPPAETENNQNEGGDTNTATSFSKESNRQLQYDQTVTHVKHAPFALRRQSIAVVLNADMAPEGGWSEADRAQLDAMVRSAVGFDQARGDLLTVSVFPFTHTAVVAQPSPWWESSQVYQLARIGIIGLVALFFVLLVVRPLLKSLLKPSMPAEEPAALPALEEEQEDEYVFESEPKTAQFNPAALTETGPLSEIRLPSPDSGLEMQVEHLQMLSRQDPERVSEVLKTWIERNETKLSASS